MKISIRTKPRNSLNDDQQTALQHKTRLTMSLSPFADPTLQVSWVLSRLDEILRIDETEQLLSGKDSHSKTIRQAILSMRSDIAGDRVLDLAVSIMGTTDAVKSVQTNKGRIVY